MFSVLTGGGGGGTNGAGSSLVAVSVEGPGVLEVTGITVATMLLAGGVGKGMLVNLSVSPLVSVVSAVDTGRGISVGSLLLVSTFSFNDRVVMGDLRRRRLRILLRERDLLLDDRELYRDLERDREGLRE